MRDRLLILNMSKAINFAVKVCAIEGGRVRNHNFLIDLYPKSTIIKGRESLDTKGLGEKRKKIPF